MKKDNNKKDANFEYKVGYLKLKIADAINKKPGQIVITNSTLEHIQIGHSAELKGLGLDAKSYVELILDNFSKIYEDAKRKSLLLVYMPENHTSLGAAITISVRDEKYYVKSAFPMNRKYLENKKLIWTK